VRQTVAFQFQPFSKKQLQVLTWWIPKVSPYADYDGIITDGAIRSGKTIADIDGFIEWSRNTFQNREFIISGKSIGALKRNVVVPMRQILAAKGIPHSYHRSENYLEFCGNTYYLFGANNEASQDVLQGLTGAGWFADEVALQPQSFIEQAIGRCSVDGSKYWLNCNPESPYHYVKTELIDKAADKRLLRFHFTMDDNLSLAESVKDRYRRMYSGVWYKRFVLGLWVAAEGAIYDMIDTAVHVVPDDKLPEMVWYAVGLDYGTGSVTTFWLLGLGKDNQLYFVDCWRWDVSQQFSQKTDVQFTDALEEWLLHGDWKPTKDLIIPRYVFLPEDAASLIVQVQQRRNTLVAAGKQTPLRNLAVADRSPGSVVDGIRDVSSLLGARKLFFASRVERKGGLDPWLAYVWDPKAQERGEDRPLKQNDHDPDAGRYVIRGTRALWQSVLR